MIKIFVESISKPLEILRKLFYLFPRKSLITIYKSFIRRPNLDYCDIIYDRPNTDYFTSNIESIQCSLCYHWGYQRNIYRVHTDCKVRQNHILFWGSQAKLGKVRQSQANSIKNAKKSGKVRQKKYAQVFSMWMY